MDNTELRKKEQLVFDLLVQSCPHVDECKKKCLVVDRETCYRAQAKSIASIYAVYMSPEEINKWLEEKGAIHQINKLIGQDSGGHNYYDTVFEPLRLEE